MHKIAAKVAKRLQKESSRSVVSLEAFKQGRQAAQDALATIQHPETLVKQGYEPVHAAYVHAQNLLSVILEGLLQLPELDRFTEILGSAEDIYMPGGPPRSPVTTSFFTAWSSFDVAIGLQKETLTSITLDLKHQLKLGPNIVTLLEHFHHSRMGIYEHVGLDQEHIRLRDLLTQETYRVFNPTGYLGHQGELWYARLLPNLQAPTDGRIGFTTPYVLTSGLDEWRAFFRRGVCRMQNKAISDERLMKYGLTPNYWLEYIFQAYWGIEPQGTAIFLKGVPDLGGTRPHFDPHATSRLPEAVLVPTQGK